MKTLLILSLCAYLIACHNPRGDSDKQFSMTSDSVLDFIEVTKKEKVKVLIIDTGVDFSNSLLSSFNHSQKQESNLENEHGTNVAGVLSLRLMEAFGKKVSQKVEFISCRYHYANNDHNQSLQKSIECLKKALEENVDIINYSAAGAAQSQEELDFFILLEKKNVPVIVASGNFGGYSNQTFPCNYGLKNIYCVGSLDDQQNIAISSVYSENVKFMAHGTNILTGCFGNVYCYQSGTSEAAPQITSLFVGKMLTNDVSILNKMVSKTKAHRFFEVVPEKVNKQVATK